MVLNLIAGHEKETSEGSQTVGPGIRRWIDYRLSARVELNSFMRF